jgi:hypothetical protein
METTLSEGATVTDVLRNEHQTIKDLFRRFDDAASDRQKKSVGDDSLRRIDNHIMLKEELFYPAVRRHVGERQRVVQALAALQVAKLLIKELRSLSSGEHYNARFNLLKENILQHLDEETSEMLPRIEKSEADLEQVAQRMIEMKRRVESARNGTVDGRTAAAVAAGAIAIGVAAWAFNRFRSEN